MPKHGASGCDRIVQRITGRSLRRGIAAETDNPPLERTVAAVYFIRGRASRARSRSTVLRYAAEITLYLSPSGRVSTRSALVRHGSAGRPVALPTRAVARRERSGFDSVDATPDRSRRGAALHLRILLVDRSRDA